MIRVQVLSATLELTEIQPGEDAAVGVRECETLGEEIRIFAIPSAICVAALRERRSAGEVQRRGRPGGVELAEPDDRAVRRQAFDLDTALTQTVQRGWVGAHLR
jgi:hypothetical protein